GRTWAAQWSKVPSVSCWAGAVVARAARDVKAAAAHRMNRSRLIGSSKVWRHCIGMGAGRRVRFAMSPPEAISTLVGMNGTTDEARFAPAVVVPTYHNARTLGGVLEALDGL